jgi:hypothetical protein
MAALSFHLVLRRRPLSRGNASDPRAGVDHRDMVTAIGVTGGACAARAMKRVSTDTFAAPSTPP